MIKIVSKKQWVTHKLQGTDMSYEQRSWYLQIKKGCCMTGKKNLEESLRRNISLGKTFSLFSQECSK